MSDTVIIAGLSSMQVIILAWIALRQKQADAVIAKLKDNTDGIKDALVASTAKASHAEGVIAGKAEEKANPGNS